MLPKLAEEKEGRGTVSDINSESEGVWVGDWDETSGDSPNVTHMCMHTRWCSGVLFQWRCLCMCSERGGDVRATATQS